MKKWIHKMLGVQEKPEQLDYYVDLVGSLYKEINRLRAELLGADSKNTRAFAVMDAGTGDVEPLDEKARANYVAAASNFYAEILEKKLMQMTAQVREQLDSVWVEPPPGFTRYDYDNFLRGTTNAFKLLIDWGTIMGSEHFSNIKKETNNE